MASDVRCKRCQGLCVRHQLQDGNIVINHALRCINCGSVVDTTILAMQALQQLGTQPVRHGKYMTHGRYKQKTMMQIIHGE